MAVSVVKFPETDVVTIKYVYRHATREGISCNKNLFDETDRVRNSVIETFKPYYCKLPSSLTGGKVNPGQAVIVHNDRYGYALGEITQINSIAPKDVELSDIVCTVDMSPYFYEVELRKKREIMRRQIEDAKREIEQTSLYELLAEKSPEFKAMLTAYKEIGGKL